MTTIVITGSTRGIGLSLAQAFLDRGCAVMLNGRTASSTEASVASLAAKVGAERLVGHAADVTAHEQVQGLWDAAVDHFGRVDIWVNNAGLGHRPTAPWDQPPEVIRSVIETNLVGAMYGSMVAMKGMLAQGGGDIYNMEGMGSDGRQQHGLIFYGTSKYGLRYFNQALAQEASDTPVRVGSLRPGMVLTDLVVGQYRGRPEEWDRVKSIFNIIADRAETVAPWMADQVLANGKNGAQIKWLTRPKLMWRFLTAPIIKRHVIDGIDPDASG
jgi:NAD(P)-dependent dehydrogenase (short-subunit alcohol dehydrogenase family)